MKQLSKNQTSAPEEFILGEQRAHGLGRTMQGMLHSRGWREQGWRAEASWPMRGQGAAGGSQGEEAGGLRVILGRLEPPYHRTDRGCGGTRHSFGEQEPGGRCNVGLQSQRRTCCLELKGPKSQAGARCRGAGDTGTQDREALMLSPRLGTAPPPCDHLTLEPQFPHV